MAGVQEVAGQSEERGTGRPGTRLVLKDGSHAALGIDFGHSHVQVAIADLARNVRAERRCDLDVNRRAIEALDMSARLASEALAESGFDRGSLIGAGIGIPGPVDRERGTAGSATILPGWVGLSIAGEMEKRLGLPVEIENDANLAAVGEYWRGVARGKDNFVFVALGTGIGSGIFADGRLYRGRTGSAGELFRLNVDWRRWTEVFPDTGYFEHYVSGMGIAAAGRRVLGTPGRRKFSGLAGARDARFVFDAMRRGNSKARALLDEIFTMLGVGVANLVAVLDPDLIVLGGGLIKGAPERMLSIVRKVVGTIHPGAPPVKLSALGDRAQTFGAIYSALDAAFGAEFPFPLKNH